MGNKRETLREKNKRKYAEETAFMDRSRKTKNYGTNVCEESFCCKACGILVVPDNAGSAHRNHCPNCLSSLHVDIDSGDRASLCKGMMDAIGVWVRRNGEWAIIHRCRICGKLSSNRIAADDNPTLLISIAVKPLAMPPFPLGRLEHKIDTEL